MFGSCCDLGPFAPVHLVILGVPTGCDCAEKHIVVDRAFACAEVNAQPRPVNAICRLVGFDVYCRLLAGLRRRTDNETRAPIAVLVQLGIGRVFGYMVVFDLSAECRGKRRGVKNGSLGRAALAGQ